MHAQTSSHPFSDRRGRPSRNSVVLVLLLVVAALVMVGSAMALSDSADDSQSEQAAQQETSRSNPETEAKQSAPDAENPEIENPFPRRSTAPSLDGGVGWLNTSGEITLKDLRGKVVLLDFWTYCCINCIHVLPDLKYLEQKYANQLVVIGVHSAKFDNEKDTENIRRAIVRYEIEHPVINDANMAVWRKFGARGWPHLVVVDPEGYYCGYVSGEGNRDLLDQVIKRLITYHRRKGTLDETPVRFDLERSRVAPTPLKFPGKILADEASGRLFISDSNHNRIVIATLDGKLLDIVGTGAMGADDGRYDEATFDHPQGMALVGETLYVADTENHLLRAIDLKAKTVATLAGTGQQARFRPTGGKLRETALNSPWALEHVDGTLYIAMAGPHQLWSHKLGSGTVEVFAGTGREDILDGSLNRSAFAQPSGFATDGEFLYVADSEGSAIRKVGLGSEGRVETVVGPSNLPNGRSLFEFGDVDGVGDEARLQHPLGLAYHAGIVYVADSYNQKIKRINVGKQEITTWLGTGEFGKSLDPPQFFEPAGVSVAGGKLYIADTNNHRIVVADLKSGKAAVLTIAGLQPPQLKPSESRFPVAAADAMEVEPQRIAAGKTLSIRIHLSFPEGYKLNTLAPVTYRLKAQDAQELVAAEHLDARLEAKADGSTATVTIPLSGKTGQAAFDLALRYGYCRDGVGGLCKLKTARWRIPLEVAADAEQTQIELTAPVAD